MRTHFFAVGLYPKCSLLLIFSSRSYGTNLIEKKWESDDDDDDSFSQLYLLPDDGDVLLMMMVIIIHVDHVYKSHV